MVAILLKAAARDAAPRRVRYHANSVVAYAQAHNGQYAGCACHIEKGVVAGGALARDQQHVGVLVSSSVRIFHYVEVVIVYAVALHVALAKPKGKVHRRGSGPRSVCLCVYHQARATIVAVAHRGDTEQAFYAGNHCQLHVASLSTPANSTLSLEGLMPPRSSSDTPAESAFGSAAVFVA